MDWQIYPYQGFDQDFKDIFTGSVGSIPVIGGMIGSLTNIIWRKFGKNNTPDYITTEEFKKSMEKLYKNMQNYVNKKIDESFIENYEREFIALKGWADEFDRLVLIYCIRNNLPIPNNTKIPVDIKNSDDDLKTDIRSAFRDFKGALYRCMKLFQHKDYKVQLFILYISTLSMYICLLRDAIKFGKDWGMPKEIIEDNNTVKTYKQEIHEIIDDFLEYVYIIGKTKYYDHWNPFEYPMIPGINVFCDFINMDPVLYPNGIYFPKLEENNIFTLPNNIDKVYRIDFSVFNINEMYKGAFQPKNFKNFLTGSRGFFTDDKTVLKPIFRFKSNNLKKIKLNILMGMQTQKTNCEKFYDMGLKIKYNDKEYIIPYYEPLKYTNLYNTKKYGQTKDPPGYISGFYETPIFYINNEAQFEINYVDRHSCYTGVINPHKYYLLHFDVIQV